MSRSIRGREDICIFQFPQQTDADAQAVRMLDKIRAGAKQAGEAEPLLRVVPVTDRTVYDEALKIAMEHLSAGVEAIWVENTDAACFGFQPKPCPQHGARPPVYQTIRVVQRLLN